VVRVALRSFLVVENEIFVRFERHRKEKLTLVGFRRGGGILNIW